MAPVIEKILGGFSLAEGPHWDDKKQSLYFLDMPASTVHKYNAVTKKHTQIKVGNQNTSVIVPVKDKKDEFVITFGRTVALINWDGESDKLKSMKTLYEVDKGTEHVFNDGKCDKTGRLWSGTMGHQVIKLGDVVDGKGVLYSFANNLVKSHRSEIGIANGIAFDYSLGKMYYVDSLRHTLDQYDIDVEEGTLSNLKTVTSTQQHGLSDDCLFDGMTIDTNGNLWVAVFASSSIYQINPRTGEALQIIKFPAAQITSVCFGGPNLDELYVTSANLADVPQGKDGGSIFRVTNINAKGFPAAEAKV